MGESAKPVKTADASAAMGRYAAGDEAAFADVYDAVAPRLYAWLLRRTRNQAWAEDLVQHTLLRIHRARGSFIPGSDVLPWAYAIAQRLHLDDLRRKQRDVTSEAEELAFQVVTSADGADAHYEASELARRLQHVLERLPASQRTAFELVRLDGLSHNQAAEVVGSTVSAIKLRAHRAYIALRAVLDELDDQTVHTAIGALGCVAIAEVED